MLVHCMVLFLVYLFLPLSVEQEMDACALVEEAMYCTCDVYGFGSAHKVSCKVSRKMTDEDLAWDGFKIQQNIMELVLSCTPDAQLDFVPSRVIRSLKQLSRFVMRESKVDTLWPYTFLNMSHLEILYLERNEIQILENYAFSYLPELKELALGENEIKRLPASALYRLPSLEKLHLDRNNMSKIDNLAFVELSSLLELDLSANHLKHFTPRTFTGLRSLKRLNLARNHLTMLTDGVFSGASALEELDLWSNQIADVGLHALDGLNRLKFLKLSHNRIHYLKDNVFKGTPALELINLGHNRLNTFQKELIVPLHLENKQNFYIDLRDNPLHCSCDLLLLFNLLDSVHNHPYKKDLRRLRCRGFPTDGSGKQNHTTDSKHNHQEYRVSKLTAEELSCSQEETTPQRTSPLSTTTVPEPQSDFHPGNIHLANPSMYGPDSEGAQPSPSVLKEPPVVYKVPPVSYEPHARRSSGSEKEVPMCHALLWALLVFSWTVRL